MVTVLVVAVVAAFLVGLLCGGGIASMVLERSFDGY